MESQQGPSQVLFDSVTAHFSITIFFYQLFLHLTYPLCLPISFYWHGWMFLYSQGFAPRNLGNIIFSYVVAVAFYLTILCALFSRDGIGFQALFPIFLYVAHRLMIAFKYATLSPGEYRRLMRGHNIRRRSLDYSHLPTDEEIRVVDNYQKQLQLLTGWLPINDERITYELIAASLLCVADMSASFKIPDPLLTADNSLQFQRWKRFLERNNFPTSALKKQVVNDESFYELDLLTFCNCVMRENRHYLTNLQPVTVILSIINACIPYFFILHKYSSLCVYSKIYYVTSGILNFIFYWATSSFMLSALEDSARRYFCAEKLATFIRAIDIDPRFQLRFKSDEYYDLFHTQSCKLQSVMRKSNSFRLSVAEPILPISQQPTQQSTSPSDTRVSSFELVSPSSPTMNPLYPPVSEYKDESQSNSSSLPAIRIADYPENIIVWMYARKLLHNFGARIRFRLDTYCGGIILLLLTLVLGVIYVFLQSGSNSSTSRADILASPLTIQVLLWIIVFTLFQAATIFIGHLTNKTMESHGYIITQHVLLLTHEVTNLHEQKESFKRDQNLFQVQNVEARINALTNCLASMKNTYCSVQAMDLVQPVRVLGIKCEGRTAVVMVYTLFLFIVALLQYAYFGSFTV